MEKYELEERADKRRTIYLCLIIILITIGLIGLFMAIIPKYNVWAKGLRGEAALREAEYSKKTQIEQAKADLESAKLWKLAEIERAEGTAKSAKIINRELEKNTNYLQYLAIQAQEKMASSPNHTQVYIPVGANGIPLIYSIK